MHHCMSFKMCSTIVVPQQPIYTKAMLCLADSLVQCEPALDLVSVLSAYNAIRSVMLLVAALMHF